MSTFSIQLWTCLLAAWLVNANFSIAQLSTVIEESQEIAPYLLFIKSDRILQLYLNETAPRILLTAESIVAIDYHYRLNQVFWLSHGIGRPAALKCGTLEEGFIKNETTLVNIGRETNPIDLAVDWINDKVYWTDSLLRQIGVYNLHTSQQSVFRDFGASGITPFGLSVLPALNNEHLYMLGHVDSINVNLFKIPINGGGQTVIRDQIRCDGGLTIDFKTNNVYWNDFCASVLETVKTDGSQYSVLYNIPSLGVSPGIALFENIFYWVQGTKLYAADISSVVNPSKLLYDAEGSSLSKVVVVHPSKQPAVVMLDPGATEQTPTEEVIIQPAPTSSSTPFLSSTPLAVVTSSLTTPTSSTPLPVPEISTPVIATTQPTSTQKVVEPTSSSMLEVQPTSLSTTLMERMTSSFVSTPPTVEPSEELLKETNKIQLLIIIIPVIVGVVIIAAVLLVVLILIYCKYRKTRKGSYTIKQVVQTRPQKQRQSTQAAKLNRLSAASDFYWQEAPPTSPSARSSGVTSFSPLCLEAGGHVGSPSARSSGVVSFSPVCQEISFPASPSARSSGVVSFSPLLQPSDDTDSTGGSGVSPFDNSLEVVHI